MRVEAQFSEIHLVLAAFVCSSPVKYSCKGRTPHSSPCIARIARAAAWAPVIVVTIGTLFSTSHRSGYFPSSVLRPLRVGVLMMSLDLAVLDLGP